MKLSEFRITPLSKEEWTEQQRKFLEPFYAIHLYNITGTFGRHWEARHNSRRSTKVIVLRFASFGDPYREQNQIPNEPVEYVIY